MEKYPRFEKADDHTIRVIQEQKQHLPLASLLKAREQILQEQAMMQDKLDHIEEAIAEAEKLGITPGELPKQPKKPIGE